MAVVVKGVRRGSRYTDTHNLMKKYGHAKCVVIVIYNLSQSLQNRRIGDPVLSKAECHVNYTWKFG